MKTFAKDDLERLARGERISPAAFWAILNDAEAVRDLASIVNKWRKIRGLFEEPRDDAEADDGPPSDVTLDELANYFDARLDDPRRREAVEAFLRQHLPELLPPARETHTRLLISGDADTKLILRGKPKPESPNTTPDEQAGPGTN